MGRLIAQRAAELGIDIVEATEFTAHPGLGAEALVGDAMVRVGNPRFFEQKGITVPPSLDARLDEFASSGATVVLVARGGRAIGAVAVKDTVRPEAAETIRRLRQLGIDRIAMLTGDNRQAAQSVADSLSIDDVRAGLLPADKVDAVGEIGREAGPVAMVGDGINDAPSLVAADVGVAMADIGSDVAIASADVVLVGGDLGKLVDTIDCSRRMLAIIWQNILAFALVFNVLAVVAASLGWVSPVEAALLHQVSSLTVVLNSLRLLIDTRRIRTQIVDRWTSARRRWRPAAAWGSVAVLLLYAASGFHVVVVGQVAVVQRFGQISHAAELPGLHYRLPYPFGRHSIVNPDEIRRVEVGFRTATRADDRQAAGDEPPAYEWNVQHRGGRVEREDDEAAVWTGDENVVDVNLVVQYRVANPVTALFDVGRLLADGQSKWDTLVRDLAEAGLRAEMSARAADSLLSADRAVIEENVARRMEEALAQYQTGFAVESVCLGDVHPPVEVVQAFRDVASAQEEKEAKINDAQAYQFEAEAEAEGAADENQRRAEAFGADRVQRAAGQADRFVAMVKSYDVAPTLTRLRLYLEMIEDSLAGRRKVIVDKRTGGARRQIFLGPKGFMNLIPPPRAEGSFEQTEAQWNQEQ